MINKSLFHDRTESYLAHKPGTASADNYNSAVAASTSALAMDPAINDLSKGIRIGKARRAAVLVALGTIAAGGTVEAYVASASQKADGASMFKVPGFSLTYLATDDNKLLKGEIDLAGLTPSAPVAGDADLNLYIRHNGAEPNACIIVILDGLEREPGQDKPISTYPASLLTN
jgi:hypothetical protein